MATHSSVLAWRIPGMGEPGGLPSMGSHRVRHSWSDLAAVAAAGEDILYQWCHRSFFVYLHSLFSWNPKEQGYTHINWKYSRHKISSIIPDKDLVLCLVWTKWIQKECELENGRRGYRITEVVEKMCWRAWMQNFNLRICVCWHRLGRKFASYVFGIIWVKCLLPSRRQVWWEWKSVGSRIMRWNSTRKEREMNEGIWRLV